MKVLRMSGTKTEEATQRWMKVQNEKLHDLCMLTHNTGLATYIWTRCVALVAHVGKIKRTRNFGGKARRRETISIN